MFLCVVILCVFMFRVPCCDVRYDFRLKTMFGSSLPPVLVGGRMSYLRYLNLFAHSGEQYKLLPVSLDCPSFIVPSIFSNVYYS